MINPELQKLIARLTEGELELNRFFKVSYTKQPAEPKGYTTNLKTPEQLDREGATNLGIHGGRFLVLLDSDTPQMYGLLSKVIPATFEVTSPRRKVPHKYLIVCGAKDVGNYEFHIEGVLDNTGKLAKCGECRVDNQYLVAPGSQVWLDETHTNLGTYIVTNDVPLARMEYEDFMAVVEPYIGKVNGVDTQKLTQEDMRNGVTSGSRHRKCVRYADFLLGTKKLDATTVKYELLSWNQKNSPPLPEADIDHCLEEAVGFISRATGIPEKTVAANGAIKNPCQTPEEAKTQEEAMKAEMIAGTLEIELESELSLVQPIPILKEGEHINPANIAEFLIQEYNIVTDVLSKNIYLYQKTQGIYNPMGEQILEKIIDKQLHQYNRMSYTKETIELIRIKTYTQTKVSEKLVLQNGLFDLTTGKISAFTPKEFAVNKLDVNYDETATSEAWLKFIDQVCPDDKLLLQEWSGYLLVRGYPFHAIMWLYGPTGRNGKGVWARTMIGILGEKNYTSVSLDEFDGKHRFALYCLKDSLFNISPEPRTDRSLTIELLQSLSGQDAIDAEAKRVQARFRFTNPAKITVMGNKFPTIDNPTEAFWERLKLCKFPNRFTGCEQVQEIEKTWLNDPKQKSAVFNWMYEGYKRLISQHGFTMTKTQEETILQFKRASDTAGAFLMEAINYEPKEFTAKTLMWEHYLSYCTLNEIPSVPLNTFANKLRSNSKIKDTSHRFDGKHLVKSWGGITRLQFDDSVEVVAPEQKTLDTPKEPTSEPKVVTDVTAVTTSYTKIVESDSKSTEVRTESSNIGNSGNKKEKFILKTLGPHDIHPCSCCKGLEAIYEQLSDEAEKTYFCQSCIDKAKQKIEADGIEIVILSKAKLDSEEDVHDYEEGVD